MEKNVKEHVVEEKLVLCTTTYRCICLWCYYCSSWSYWRYPNLSQIYNNLQGLMYLVILKGIPYDLLNHVRDVGSKTTTLEGPLADTPDLAPYEIKDAKRSCIRCHPME